MSGRYGDYRKEALELALATIEAFRVISELRPPILPHIIVRISAKSLKDEKARKILEIAHELAASRSLPYFDLGGARKRASIQLRA